ncbi:hypothetical protein [Paraburkholderia sp. SIMBA_027]|uniref:hypothetical protein n=1 Tax=Paraburkholderia sp. SIMBA_027 TaxID=3085770 RepID=UPI0039797674
MSSITKYKAMELATQIVTAAAEANNLKLFGVPNGTLEEIAQTGEKDGTYIAALLNTIADKIKTV